MGAGTRPPAVGHFCHIRGRAALPGLALCQPRPQASPPGGGGGWQAQRCPPGHRPPQRAAQTACEEPPAAPGGQGGLRCLLQAVWGDPPAFSCQGRGTQPGARWRLLWHLLCDCRELPQPLCASQLRTSCRGHSCGFPVLPQFKAQTCGSHGVLCLLTSVNCGHWAPVQTEAPSVSQGVLRARALQLQTPPGRVWALVFQSQ